MTAREDEADDQAVAWRWEQWSSLVGAWTPRLTFDRPDDGKRVRNVQPLYAAPPPTGGVKS